MRGFKEAFNKLSKEIESISIKENRCSFGLYMNAMWCFFRYGITPNEYLGWNCWCCSNHRLKSFYTARDSFKYEKVFNNQDYAHFFDNKVDFNLKFSDFVKRDWIYTKECSDKQIEFFIKNHDKMVVKPIGLSSGRGIYCISSGDILKPQDDCLIEEYIKQHPSIEKLNPSSVNSIRVYTITQKTGSPKVLSASIRVGGKNAEEDNYHSGGCGYPIDIATGIVYAPGTDIKGVSHLFHPSTGVKMIGFEIPNWAALLDFVYKAMTVVPEARLLAWDVAVLENGFEMIEGNYNGDPGFMQAPSKQGKKREILNEL